MDSEEGAALSEPARLTQEWNACWARRRGLLDKAQGELRGDPLAFVKLLKGAQRLERRWWRYLRLYFGWDAHALRFERPWCAPCTDRQWVAWDRGLRERALWDSVLLFTTMAAQAAHDRREDFRAVGVHVYFDTLREWPSIVAGMTIDAVEWERVQLDAICDLGGWAAARLKLGPIREDKYNQRLIRSLASDGRARYRTMMEWLPTSAFIGWNAYRADDEKARRKHALPGRISKVLEAEKPDNRKLPRSGAGYATDWATPLWSLDADVPDPFDIEGFVLREEARQAILRLLTPREAEFWRLDDEGYSDAEIAQRMGVKIGTVGATLARVRAKIKEARAAS